MADDSHAGETNRNSAAEFLKCIFSQDSLIQGITEYENDSKGLGFLD